MRSPGSSASVGSTQSLMSSPSSSSIQEEGDETPAHVDSRRYSEFVGAGVEHVEEVEGEGEEGGADEADEGDEGDEGDVGTLNERLSEAAFGDGMMLDSMDHQDVQDEEHERCALSAKYINARLAKRREADPELGIVDPELDALMKPQILYAFLEVMSQESLRPFGSMNKLASTNKVGYYV